ncbi:GIY-YIG nuclease family protein [Candidatus Parcubacteria bacterium]|nr:GIY-YIG nuclease family protein [Candidatus Parcubacteria bacterium]
MYYTYILFCNNNLFYTGFTNKLKIRLQQHQRAEVKYTSNLLPIKLVYYEKYQTKKKAIQREKQIKGWLKQKKINLIKFGHPNKTKLT